MDNQLKHRLTGATILVLLIVLLVPEMLSGPQPATTPEVLPAGARADDVPIRSFDINVSEREPAAAPVAEPAAAPAAPPQAAPAAAPATATESTAGPAAAPSSRPASAPPRAANAGTSSAGTYFVQMGSFSARGSANNLAAQLKSAGFPASVTPVTAGGRTLHRVRVGPVGDRSAGEALAKRLRAAGHVGSVVAGP